VTNGSRDRPRRHTDTVADRAARVARIVAAGALAMLLAAVPEALARQVGPGGDPAAPRAGDAPDPEAEAERGAPVLIGGEPVVWVPSGVGPYSAQFRAERITRRAAEIVHDRAILDPSVVVAEAADTFELRIGPRLLMVITAQDARAVGVSGQALAAEYARLVEDAIRAERLRYAPGTLIRSGVSGLAATVLLAVLLWLSKRLARAARRVIGRWQSRLSLRVQQQDLVPAESLAHALHRAVTGIHVVLALVLLDLYLTFVLGLFPWTRAVSMRLLDYLLTPLRVAAAAVVGYLPNLLFVVVIAGLVGLAIRFVGLLFQRIGQGSIAFASFPAEWADPTNKIVRVLLLAFGLVVAFPYLPASDSAAFAGVSVFMGVLFSLSSSSAIANMVAGVVLTYTNAFRHGDRVQVGEAYGDIVETALLATRIRTIKNEYITIPNNIVLGSAMTNFSRSPRGEGLILHTSVTIGYDAPWRQVHDLLIGAALSTPGLLQVPPPFVWQTALNDFYVTYEVNAYTAAPQDMIGTYAALHARIQDAFCAAGVEIMSPHYTSVRDGNTIAIPVASRAAAYRAPAFRVEVTEVALRRE
jgi:small-conductance mechanosensitive channel